MSAVKEEILLPLIAGEATTTLPILSAAPGAILNAEEALSVDWPNLREEKRKETKSRQKQTEESYQFTRQFASAAVRSQWTSI
jgi:hypothetical protein